MQLIRYFAHLERFTFGRRFRLYIALLAIGQGIIRLGAGTSQHLAFGSNIFYGTAMLSTGILLFISVVRFRRTHWFSRLCASLLAAIYGTISIAAWDASTSSAYAALLMTIILLTEVAAIHEC